MIPESTLLAIQERFHALIRHRNVHTKGISTLKLPELKSLLTADERKAWFPVPGMYGGFSYWLEGDDAEAKLVSESWCRVVGGSGQRHEITSDETKLLDEGFV
jgi:hypothetical protein